MGKRTFDFAEVSTVQDRLDGQDAVGRILDEEWVAPQSGDD